MGGDNLQTAATVWPTASARDWKGVDRQEVDRGNARPLNEVASTWATPRVSMIKATGNAERFGGRLGQGNIEDQFQRWSTPRATDGEKGGPNQAFGAGGVPLPAMAAGINWSTPSVADVMGGRKARSGSRSGELLNNSLAPYVTNNIWPTATAVNRPRNDETLAKCGAYRKAKAGQTTVPLYLEEVALSSDLLAPETSTPGDMSPSSLLACYRRYRATTDFALRWERRALLLLAIRRRDALAARKPAKHGGAQVRVHRRGWTRERASAWVRPTFRRQLNARFVEWLMSWPPGLTSFECSETALLTHKALWRSELASMTLLPAAPPAQLSLFG